MNARGIGAVVKELREEFPGVSISKLRFLDAEGIVTPTRRPSGYRVYTDDDVDRLRFVLRAQRDSYAPLAVIKQRLNGDRRVVEFRPGDVVRSDVVHGLLVRSGVDNWYWVSTHGCSHRDSDIRQMIDAGHWRLVGNVNDIYPAISKGVK